MRNLALTLRFVGTNFHGFQVQKNARSVCEALQDGLEAILGSRHEVKGCSRTDAGVHANQYVLSFKTESRIACSRLPLALNTALPADLAVLHCREVPEDFHARYSATGKRYIYRIYNSRLPDPFLEGRAWRIPAPLDERLMQAAAPYLTGRRDFSSFCTLDDHNRDKDKVRTVHNIEAHREGQLITIAVTGDGFLYNMVRILCGTLVYVAQGKIPLEALPGIVAGRDRKLAGPTLPACGLYLDEVFYE